MTGDPAQLQRSCLALLERVRWPERADCPRCGSERVRRKADGGRLGRWNCHDCRSSFNVLSGTILSKTRLPLATWFCALEQVVDAGQDLTTRQLAHDLELDPRTAWALRKRIEEGLAGPEAPLLRRLVQRLRDNDDWLTDGLSPSPSPDSPLAPVP